MNRANEHNAQVKELNKKIQEFEKEKPKFKIQIEVLTLSVDKERRKGCIFMVKLFGE